MVIERSTTNISVVKDDKVLEQARRVTSGPIFGIVGIMNVLGNNYLGVIENAAQVGTLNKAKIFKRNILICASNKALKSATTS